MENQAARKLKNFKSSADTLPQLLLNVVDAAGKRPLSDAEAQAALKTLRFTPALDGGRASNNSWAWSMPNFAACPPIFDAWE
jgi:hypothetical protein